MKIGIAILSYRATPVSLWPRFMVAEGYCRSKGINTVLWCYGHALVHQARNVALCEMGDVDFQVFIDDDMLLQPQHIHQLISLDKPVASGLCTTRNHPVRLAAKKWDPENEQFCELDFCRRRVSGQFAVGAAFLAIRRDAIDTLVERHLSGRDWLEDNRRAFDRMHVRAENREKERARIEGLRRRLWETSKVARIFDFPTEDRTQLQLGEDIGFGLRCMQAGIDVTIDPEIAPGHVGEYAYSLADYEPEGGWTKEKPATPKEITEDDLIGMLQQV